MPICRPLPGPAAHLLQAPAYCAQAHSIETDPCKDAPNDVCLRFRRFETRHSAALTPAHVAIPEGGPCQCTNGPGLCGMSAATPAALQNFGSFVFGDHALNLEQEIILRGAADRTVQKNNLRARAVKLIDQQHLMGVTAGEPVRSVDVDALDMAASNRIPQTLQSRAKQDRTTVAFVHVVVIRFELKAVGSDPLPQRGDLAGDRIIARA